MSARTEAIQSIIERVTAREGLELVHWELVGPRNQSVLRIYIDKEGGVTHGDCELVSHQVGTLLDVEDLFPGHYLLEVSSPGVDRPLFKRADYERFAGRRVKIRTQAPVNGQRNFRGQLKGIDGDVVRLEAEPGGEIEIDFANITKANIEFEF